MMCQSCGKKTATTHIKTIVNGKLAEYHLCADCAKQKGYSNIFSNWGMEGRLAVPIATEPSAAS